MRCTKSWQGQASKRFPEVQKQVVCLMIVMSGLLHSQAYGSLTHQVSDDSPYTELIAPLDLESLRHYKEQIVQQLKRTGLADLERKEQTDPRLRYRWIQTPFPQPMLYYTALVQVESIKRVDQAVLQVYPNSPPDFPYYELTARVLKVWEEKFSTSYGDFRLKAGDVLPLLWIGCELDWETLRERVLSPPWKEPTGVYLVYDLDVVSKQGIMPHISEPPFSSNPQDYWWVLYSSCVSPLYNPRNILTTTWLVPGFPELWDASIKPTPWIASPPAEVVEVLDEESVFVRLPEQWEVRWEWIRQRVLDTRLPLWKRQRALGYWKDCFPFRPPEDRKELGNYLRRYVEVRIMYLTFLHGLSEPELQGCGLRAMRPIYTAPRYVLPVEFVERYFEAVLPFLGKERMVEVRREAARVVLDCIVRSWGESCLGLDREWTLRFAGRLQKLALEESDDLVRDLLKAAGVSLEVWDLERQRMAVEKRLRELEATKR